MSFDSEDILIFVCGKRESNYFSNSSYAFGNTRGLLEYREGYFCKTSTRFIEVRFIFDYIGVNFIFVENYEKYKTVLKNLIKRIKKKDLSEYKPKLTDKAFEAIFEMVRKHHPNCCNLNTLLNIQNIVGRKAYFKGKLDKSEQIRNAINNV